MRIGKVVDRLIHSTGARSCMRRPVGGLNDCGPRAGPQRQRRKRQARCGACSCCKFATGRDGMAREVEAGGSDSATDDPPQSHL